MIPPLISAALLFAPFVPKIIDFLGEDDSTQVAKKTVLLAKEITQCDSPQEALEKLWEQPDLQEAFIQNITQFLSLQEELHLENLRSARNRDVILSSLGVHKRADIMVICASVGLVFCVIALSLFKESLSGEVTGIISTICGIFGSCLKDAFGFEFGSSRGSREKDLIITKGLL